MLDDNHLHIDSGDQLTAWLSGALKSVKEGSITIMVATEPAAKITANTGNIAVDFLNPNAFKIAEDDTGLFDKLKTATEFARKLSNAGVTVSFLRQGKETLKLGKGAKPTLSRIITRSDDVQISGLRELAKLKADFKTDT